MPKNHRENKFLENNELCTFPNKKDNFEQLVSPVLNKFIKLSI